MAGTMGMCSVPIDQYFWKFVAYVAGTEGSIFIIGFAAGIAVMGKISLKRIFWIALIGYFAG